MATGPGKGKSEFKPVKRILHPARSGGVGIYIYIYISWRPSSRVTRRLLFHKLQHRGVGEGATPFPGLLHFTLEPYC